MEDRDQQISLLHAQTNNSYPINGSGQETRAQGISAEQASQAPSMHGAPPLQQHPQQHYYAAQNGHHVNHTTQSDYRGPTNGTSAVSLPSIQHFEPAQSAVQPQHQHYAPLSSDGMVQQNQQSYQYHNGIPPMMHSTAPVMYAGREAYPDRRYSPQQAPIMYAHSHVPHIQLDPRQMSGGRHKKEIKRRTKTGCLTCRKRRIKCDERHPTCRNCEKSKRECLGYDPIFKQQPGPAPIQPAPTGGMSGKASHEVATGYGQPHTQYPAQQEVYSNGHESSSRSLNGTYQNGPYGDTPPQPTNTAIPAEESRGRPRSGGWYPTPFKSDVT